MLIEIPKVLSPEQVADILRALEQADWTDGRGTAGYLSSRVKDNVQLPDTSPVARKLGGTILDALDRNQRFISAALPLRIMPPFFNRYSGGQSYGSHIDGAIRPVGAQRVRTDLSATLFLSAPDSYEGGELVVEDTFGPRRVKLAAGDMVLYPGTSVHHVVPVTRGTRIASFFWLQSMVRGNEQRAMLFELDAVVQKLGGAPGVHEEAVRLAGLYHNLLRLWADT